MSPFSFDVSRLSRLFNCRGFPTGGDDGIRTHDPLLAGQVLSQLSYTPIYLGEFPSWSLKIEQQAIFTRILSAPICQKSLVNLVYKNFSVAQALLAVTTFSIERR